MVASASGCLVPEIGIDHDVDREGRGRAHLHGSRLRGAGRVISGDNARHEFVADDVFARKRHVRDAFDIGQKAHRLGETRCLSRRQIDLARIAGDDHAAILAQTV